MALAGAYWCNKEHRFNLNSCNLINTRRFLAHPFSRYCDKQDSKLL